MKYLHLLCLLIVSCVSPNASNVTSPKSFTGTGHFYKHGTDTLSAFCEADHSSTITDTVTITVTESDSFFKAIGRHKHYTFYEDTINGKRIGQNLYSWVTLYPGTTVEEHPNSTVLYDGNSIIATNPNVDSDFVLHNAVDFVIKAY